MSSGGEGQGSVVRGVGRCGKRCEERRGQGGVARAVMRGMIEGEDREGGVARAVTREAFERSEGKE